MSAARALFGIAALLGTLSLSACSERPQTMDAASRAPDAQPWTASKDANPAFKAAGWKEGDKTAWEEQIRKRNQAQNDYAR